MYSHAVTRAFAQFVHTHTRIHTCIDAYSQMTERVWFWQSLAVREVSSITLPRYSCGTFDFTHDVTPLDDRERFPTTFRCPEQAQVMPCLRNYMCIHDAHGYAWRVRTYVQRDTLSAFFLRKHTYCGAHPGGRAIGRTRKDGGAPPPFN